MRIRRQTFGRTLTPVLVLVALFLFANCSDHASETAAPSPKVWYRLTGLAVSPGMR